MSVTVKASKLARLGLGGVLETDERASGVADESTIRFRLRSSIVSSSDISFLSLEGFSRFLKHSKHKNESVDAVQQGNICRANSVNTGTTCWEAGVVRLRRLLLFGRGTPQALHR